MLELAFHRGTAVELAHLSSWQWQKRAGYLCVAAGSLSLGGFPFVPARARKSFQCRQHFQAILPTEPQAGFVCCLWAALCTASKGRQENGWCGDQIKGKKQGFTACFFYLSVFYWFTLLFQAVVSGDLSFSIQKLGCCFCLRGRRDARKSPDSLRDDLDFLFISRLMEISCFMACISPGS